MFEENMGAALLHGLPNPCDMRIEVLPLAEVPSAMTASITLPVHLAHMLAKLGLLLKVIHGLLLFCLRLVTDVTCEPPLMGASHMLPLLITIWEGLQAAC